MRVEVRLWWEDVSVFAISDLWPSAATQDVLSTFCTETPVLLIGLYENRQAASQENVWFAESVE